MIFFTQEKALCYPDIYNSVHQPTAIEWIHDIHVLIFPAAARRRQGGRLTRLRKNTRLPRGETMLASFLTLTWFRPLSAVLFGASAGGDAPHRTPPQRRPLPPAFRCISEHSTVQDRRLPADLRLAP